MDREQRRPNRLYKYRPLTTDLQRRYVREILVSNHLFFSSASAFLDPFEFRIAVDSESGSEAIRIASSSEVEHSNVGIVSLSETHNNPLMWSFYADWFTGICVGFDASLACPFFGRAQPVRYQDEIPLQLRGQSKLACFLSAALTKPNRWQHEKEWRIIEIDAASQLRSFPPVQLKEIILGCKMDEQTMNLICNWINERALCVPIFRSVTSRSSYSLDSELERIN
jgi:hypothetical protein